MIPTTPRLAYPRWAPHLARLGPASPLGMALVGAWLLLAWTNGGYPVERWGPIGIGVLVGLALALVLVPVGRLGGLHVVASVGMGGFLAVSYLSLLWATSPGDAWVGADRQAIAIASFFVFLLWPWSQAGAGAIVGSFSLGVAASAGVELARLAMSPQPTALLDEGRLVGPIGYANGTVAWWMLAFWPAVHLGATRAAPRYLRPVFLAGATILLCASVLGQSRGWALVLLPAALTFVACARQRMRWTLGLLVAGAPALIALAPLLEVYDAAAAPSLLAERVDRATSLSFLAGAISAAAGVAWTLADERVSLSPKAHRLAAVATAVTCFILAVVAATVALSTIGDPRSWARRQWHDLAHAYSLPSQDGGSRLLGSLSGRRYEEWRIAWHQFQAHVLLGAGPDNFAAAYLQARSDNFHEPRHPHSFPLRLLSQGGIVGAALFAVAVGAAAWSAARRRRTLPAPAAGTVGACLAAGAYWLLHASTDIFWEIPALAAPALGLLALAANVAETDGDGIEAVHPPRAARSAAGAGRRAALAQAAAAVAVAGALALPWLSDLYAQSAARAWPADPVTAYRRLELASTIDPLSAQPFLLEGSIALRRREPGRARRAFARALERDPASWYAYLQLALLEGSLGRYRQAERYLAQSLALNPNERVSRLALRLVREHAPIRPETLNRVFVDPAFRPPGIESYTHHVQDRPQTR